MSDVDETTLSPDEIKRKHDLELVELNLILLEQSEQIVAINRLNGRLSGSVSINDILDGILDTLSRKIGIKKAAVAMMKDGCECSAIKITGLDGYEKDHIMKTIDSDEAVRKVIETRRRLSKRGFGAQTSIDRLFEGWIIYPFRWRNTIPAIMIADIPNTETGDAVGMLANQCGVYFANVLLLDSLKDSNSSLEAANAKLNEIDKMKTDFLNMVAHDLRTPLSSIRNFIDILITYKDEPEETKDKFLNTIKSETVRLTNLINDFLDLARIEAGVIKYDNKPFRIQPVIDHVADVYRGDAIRKGIRLDVETQESLPDVFADSDRITQVLTNIVSNAVKFTPEGGTIRIMTIGKTAAEKDDDKNYLEVRISDSGPGIDPQYHGLIFEKFGRIMERESKSLGGTGLGLAIAKEMITAFGGRIWVESEKGKGSTFVFDLPFIMNEK